MNSQKQSKSYMIRIIYAAVILGLPLILAIYFNLGVGDYFLFVFLIALAAFSIATPSRKNTKRGRICTVIQIYSTIGFMAGGGYLGIVVLDNSLLGLFLSIGGMYGSFILLEWLYLKAGVSAEERSFR